MMVPPLGHAPLRVFLRAPPGACALNARVSAATLSTPPPIADHFIIYGGLSAASGRGVAGNSDLWVFTIPTSTWYLIPRSNPWPTVGNTFPFPAGVIIGAWEGRARPTVV